MSTIECNLYAPEVKLRREAALAKLYVPAGSVVDSRYLPNLI
jgi:hypothetical protein